MTTIAPASPAPFAHADIVTVTDDGVRRLNNSGRELRSTE
jgi:hypothetical protein